MTWIQPLADFGSQVFDLAHAADAYRALEGGHGHGKVVMRASRLGGDGAEGPVPHS